MIVPLGWLLATLMLHPVQETFAEVQLNDRTGRIEVSLRLSQLDEQTWVRAIRGASDRETKVLVENFRFGNEQELTTWPNDSETQTSLRKRYHWVGRQDEGAHVWWYFEYEPAPGDVPSHVRCRFFDRNDPTTPAPAHTHPHAAPVHRFNVINGKTVKAITTNSSNPVAKIEWNPT
ncbi:DUF6702 family protein [Neorhodopirellula pilleata]|uniref:Uncharacterized protein n=1 Tax=Neorhodopirellula pilleata TaxID=2714738 RepID=A0A5C5ZYQ9_9BACT|nr:DUF6702 family protein [Neorhodopirellula pilleata]TWT92185.1 hypothetical protein Pla100_47220 [Neorhodopirellula pilleata]